MNRILYVALYSACLTFHACQGFKQNIEWRESKDRFTREVDSLVISKMNTYDIPGLAIGLVVGDSVIINKGYGVKEINTSRPVTEYSNFHTASISKLFTAQAIMLLVEENKISLEDRLLKIAPELNYTDQRVEKITILSLLNHSSGLPDVADYHWEDHNQSDQSLEDYVQGFDLKLKHEPFSQYDYSNLGYNLLGYVIEKVTDTSFDLYLKENILEVSGMSNSDFRYYTISDTLKTSPHSRNRITRKIYKRKTYPYTREQAPSSTLNSSVSDLSKWMISFLKLVDSDKAENVFSQMTKPSFEAYPQIGLGFQLSTLENRPVIGHYGGDQGYRSYLLMIPEEKIGLVLLANCDYNEDFRQEIIHPIAKRMLSIYKP